MSAGGSLNRIKRSSARQDKSPRLAGNNGANLRSETYGDLKSFVMFYLCSTSVDYANFVQHIHLIKSLFESLIGLFTDWSILSA